MIETTDIALPEYSDEIWGHPKGLFVCFVTEMWERFSFYGMKALLLLYLTKYHLFSDAAGLDVLGSYAALVYAVPIIGGLLADRYLGMRKAVVFGAVLLCFGHLGMAWEGHQAYRVAGKVVQDVNALQVFYLSLALIVVGVGFLKPNISTIVGKLYAENDPRRDSGFTIFYMGINLGAFLATILCGYLGESYGWSYGFGAAGIGMLLGLTVFLWGQPYFKGHAEPPSPAKLQEKLFSGLNREWLIYLGGIAFVAVVWQMVQLTHVVEHSLNGMSLLVLAGLTWFIVFRCNAVERSRMVVLIALTVSTVVFWALFEQSAGSMILYVDRVVDSDVFGVTISAAQFTSLNSIFIFILAPLFSWLWIKLAGMGREPSTPVKFGLGIVQAGLGFAALVIGAAMPNEAGKVALIWLVLAYLLHTTGELCLSPVGLSAVTTLAVPSVVGVMMGAWFLAIAYAEFVAAQIAKFAAIDFSVGEVVNTAKALAGYTDFFSRLVYVGVGFGILLLLLSPLLRRGMRGVH